MAKVKVQILLPEEMVVRIEEDCRGLFMKKSSWFEKMVHLYFEKDAEGKDKKKKLELDI